MIRFIDLTDQITEDEFTFAWFDTIYDRFIKIGGMQIWHTWQVFEYAFVRFGHIEEQYTLVRFAGLFPKEVNRQHRGATAAAGGSEIK